MEIPKITIIEKKDNPLLNRQEIKVKLEVEGATPKKDLVQELIAKETKKEKNLVVIKKIHQKFGIQESEILAYIYKNQEELKKYEPKKKEKKGKKEKQEKKETKEKTEKPAEIKPAELKPEEKEQKHEEKSAEKKEEKKPEEKKE